MRNTPAGLNIGLANARGAYIARMDAHTLYPEDYLARGVARLRRGDADHVSGPQLAHGDGTWSRRVALALDTPLGRGGAQFRQASNGEIEVDSGFTGVWPRSMLEAHGGWDEDWPNDQDSELAARIRGGGGRIVCLPEMGAEYIPRDSLKALARQYWRYGVYRAKTSGRPSGEHAPLPPARSEPRARRWPSRSSRSARLRRLGRVTVARVVRDGRRRGDGRGLAGRHLCRARRHRRRTWPPCRRSSAPCTSPGASASCSAAPASGRRCGRSATWCAATRA